MCVCHYVGRSPQKVACVLPAENTTFCIGGPTVCPLSAAGRLTSNMLPGSSQEPFPWAGDHEALYNWLQDRGREWLSQVQKKKHREHGNTELESWEG